MENEQYLDWNYHYAWGEFAYEHGMGKETRILENHVPAFTEWPK